ncbi:hypothetical protein FGX01_02790, partial [Xylella fastidiosa subsp. multiplex]|nr:hypothetical protein [Xylella fastidiosa subsp. multiplex]
AALSGAPCRLDRRHHAAVVASARVAVAGRFPADADAVGRPGPVRVRLLGAARGGPGGGGTGVPQGRAPGAGRPRGQRRRCPAP